MTEMTDSFDEARMNLYDLDFEEYTVTVSLSRDSFLEKIPERNSMNSHSGFEFHFLASGKMEIFAGEERIEAGKWEYVLIPPGLPHLVVSPADAFSVRYRMQLTFKEKNDGGKRRIRVLENRLVRNFIRTVQNRCIRGYSEDMVQCLKRVEHEIKAERMFSDQTAELYLKIVVIGIMRNLGRSDYVKSSKVTTPDEKRLYIIDSFFNQNYRTCHVDKQVLADRLYLSTRQLERLLIKLYGQSFHEKLLTQRIGQAKFLLANTDYTLDEVAAMSGFSSVKYFSCVFKEKTGSTPYRHRKNASVKTERTK